MPFQIFHSGCALLSALRVFNDTLENESAPLHVMCVDVAKLATAVSEFTALLESQFQFDGAIAEVMDAEKNCARRKRQYCTKGATQQTLGTLADTNRHKQTLTDSNRHNRH